MDVIDIDYIDSFSKMINVASHIYVEKRLRCVFQTESYIVPHTMRSESMY